MSNGGEVIIMKKTSMIFTSMLVSSVLLSGCSPLHLTESVSQLDRLDTQENEQERTYEVATVRWGDWGDSYHEGFPDEAAKDTGIKIQWDTILHEDWGNRKAVLLAGSDLPDAFMGSICLDEYDILNDTDTFIALDDYIDQYMPNFKPEHHMRLFWFNHFAANLYVTAFGVWDSIIEMLNIFYDINAKPDLRQRNEVLKWLKTNKNDVFVVFDGLKDNPIYIKANGYRTQFVHGIAPSEISNQNTYKKDTEAKIVDSEESIRTGKAVYKTVKHATVMSVGVGQYTKVKDVLEIFEEFAKLTASKKDEILNLLTNNSKE